MRTDLLCLRLLRPPNTTRQRTIAIELEKRYKWYKGRGHTQRAYALGSSPPLDHTFVIHTLRGHRFLFGVRCVQLARESWSGSDAWLWLDAEEEREKRRERERAVCFGERSNKQSSSARINQPVHQDWRKSGVRRILRLIGSMREIWQQICIWQPSGSNLRRRTCKEVRSASSRPRLEC
jgi:hypothetical protein